MGVARLRTSEGRPDRGPTLVEEMKPLLQVLRLINILPLQFSADGGASFSWRSPLMLVAALGWSAVFVDVVYETNYRVELFVTSLSHFSEAVFNTFFFIIMHHQFLTPFLHWPAAPAFADYLTDWGVFQHRFMAVTERPLRPSVRSLATHKATACLAVPFVLCGAMSAGLDTVNWHNLIIGWLAAVFHAAVPALWDVLGTATVSASHQLTARFQEEVAARGGCPPPALVREYRELWLELRGLAERSPSAWGLGTLHYLLCGCISSVLVNGFGILANVTEAGATDRVMTTAMFLILVDSLWHTAVVCSAGQRMAAAVSSGARGVLLGMRTSAPHPEALQLQREVKSFLNAMRKPLVISLQGFLDLKLTLIVTIVNTLITYLCVLLQFTIKLQSQ